MHSPQSVSSRDTHTHTHHVSEQLSHVFNTSTDVCALFNMPITETGSQ